MKDITMQNRKGRAHTVSFWIWGKSLHFRCQRRREQTWDLHVEPLGAGREEVPSGVCVPGVRVWARSGEPVKAREPLRKPRTPVAQHDADSLFESFFRRGFSVSACDIRNRSYKG